MACQKYANVGAKRRNKIFQLVPCTLYDFYYQTGKVIPLQKELVDYANVCGKWKHIMPIPVNCKQYLAERWYC